MDYNEDNEEKNENEELLLEKEKTKKNCKIGMFKLFFFLYANNINPNICRH